MKRDRLVPAASQTRQKPELVGVFDGILQLILTECIKNIIFLRFSVLVFRQGLQGVHNGVGVPLLI